MGMNDMTILSLDSLFLVYQLNHKISITFKKGNSASNSMNPNSTLTLNPSIYLQYYCSCFYVKSCVC